MVSAPPVPVFPFRRTPSARRFRPRPCQFSRFVARHPPDVSAPSVPFSRFVARHPPDVSAPARASFPVSSRAIRPTFPPLPCRFPVSSRAIRPTFPPRPCIFPLRRALFARRSRLSVRFPVASCVTRSASLPVRPVSRSAPFRASCAPFFLSFAGYYCT